MILDLSVNFFGIEVQRDKTRGLLKIFQTGYVDEILQMTDAHPRNIPLDPGTKFSRLDEPKCICTFLFNSFSSQSSSSSFASG